MNEKLALKLRSSVSEFLDGRFDTTYLDEVLKTRNGRPFFEAPPSVEDVAAMAVALQAVLAPSAVAAPAGGVNGQNASLPRWRSQARAEGLRD